jgi:hypothetical protein
MGSDSLIKNWAEKYQVLVSNKIKHIQKPAFHILGNHDFGICHILSFFYKMDILHNQMLFEKKCRLRQLRAVG